MAKTPEENALAAVAKAITDENKAQEKLDAAKEKYQAADAAFGRAAKTTKWTASHPDLPDDFDLAAFRAELDAPFAEEESDTEENQDEVPADLEAEGEAIGDAIESGEIDPDQLEVPDDASAIDDPFGDDEPVAAVPTRRRKER